MQYPSNCPKAWKLGLINFYLNRALKLSSNFFTFQEELFKIKKLLLKNQYPKQLIESKINKFLEDHKVNNITFKQSQTTKNKTKSNQEKENYFYFTTIYVGNPSLKFQNRIKSVFQKYNIEIKPAYTNRKISNYFNNKSKCCSEAFDVNVIYKYNFVNVL